MVSGTRLGQVVLDGKRKEAEQSVEDKLISNVLP